MGDAEAKDFKIVLEILETPSNANVKLRALEFLLGMTVSTEGLNIIYKNVGSVLLPLVKLLFHSNSEVACKAAALCVNISAEAPGVQIMTSSRFPEFTALVTNNVCRENGREGIVSIFLEHIFNDGSFIAEQAGMVLANLSRDEVTVNNIFELLGSANDAIERISLIALRTDKKYDYLSFLLANMSQLPEARKILMNSTRFSLQKLLQLIDCERAIRRKGIISLIRNLCLSIDNHDKLLDPEVDLLSKVLLPLAGPEKFDDEDNEKLPLDLQYLPNDKIREPDAAIRKMLLEIIMQLCVTKSSRELMRKNNVYVILRELHKWERDVECLITCEDVVNIIIRTEEEIGVDNFKDIVIPPDLTEKFNKVERIRRSTD